jgi:catechol 2,3-dioxygenase-like lactoylglutathione lyase family enzyme
LPLFTEVPRRSVLPKFASPWQNSQRWKRNGSTTVTRSSGYQGKGPDLAIDKVLADVAVDDFTSALTWYERLLGRPADAAPMEGLAEWHLAEGGGIQVSDDEDRAGSSNVTLVVSSLDEQLAALEAEGIPVGPIQGTPGVVKAATVTDPEGNLITFAEDLADKN